jgi:hypothetical protein
VAAPPRSLPQERQRRDVGRPESRFTDLRLRGRAGDACVNRRKASRVKRLSWLAALVATLLVGCKDPQGDTSPSFGLVRAGTDIVIKDVRTYAPGDAIAGTNDEYYVVTFNFTNAQGFALVPRIDHFVLEDQDRIRYLGADSGNANLVGISNYSGLLKVGDSHDYTVGFRVPQNTHALLIYDATF